MNNLDTQLFTSLDYVLTIEGFKVTARVEQDDIAQAPWEREEGHGPVSEWTSREKKEGERVLCNDRYHFRYYDFDAAVKQAKEELWGECRDINKNKEVIAIKAVEADFKRLKDWCNDEWMYIGIVVTVSKAGIELGSRSLWGIESDSNDYHIEVANELLNEVMNEARKKLKELCE
jgi:hypothetical protein